MTQSIVLFLSVCSAICFFLALIVVYPWLTGTKPSDNRLMAVNVDTFYERLDELQSDKDSGVISDEFYNAQVLSLQRQLIDAKRQTPVMLPSSTKSRLIVLVWIPILCALFYLTIADRSAVFKLWVAQDAVGQVADDLLTGKTDTPPDWATKDSSALISAMQTNVHYHAYDANRWMRLSELFMSLEATPQALEALARAYRLAPNDEKIASTYAQVSFFANDGKLDNTILKVVDTILKNNPTHEGALMLMAMADARAGRFDNAKLWVGKLRTLIASKSGDHTSALASLDKLEQTIDDQKNTASQGITVNVTIDKALQSNIQPTDTLFVAISDIKGGAPYAVQKLALSDTNADKISVNLSNFNAMLKDRTLAVAYQNNVTLVVSARISKSGNAMSQSGDLSANPVPLAKQKTVDIVINQIVP